MKAKIKDHLSRILSLTLIAILTASLLLAADIFYPKTDNIAYAAESSSIGANNYTTGISSNITSTDLAAGTKNITFGGATWEVAARNTNYAVLVMTAPPSSSGFSGGWPGYVLSSDYTGSHSFGSANSYYTSDITGYNIANYSTQMTSLYNSIKNAEYTSASGDGLYLVSNSTAGTTSSGNQGSGYYWEALKTAAAACSSFGATDYDSWLGTVYGSNFAWYVYSNGYVYNDNYQSGSYVVAPAFNLDTSKAKLSGNALTVATFTASTAIQGSQSISSIEEGASLDLSTLMGSVTYKNGDNAGKSAQYKITITDGTLGSDNITWTAPTGINKDKTVSFTVKDTAVGLTLPGSITVTPRAAGSVSVEKSSSFPESVTVGDSVDLSDYITVTGLDSGSQSDGAISSYSLAVSGDYGTFSGTTYTPDNVSSSRVVSITVTPSGFPVLSGSTGTVNYSSKTASFDITVKPNTTGWTERDESTDALGFHTYTDSSTGITWKYRYNDEGYIVYLYTEDDVSSIISDAHVLLVPSSINGVSVVGIGGGSKDTTVIPFIPTSGSNVNDTWTSIYIPSSIKQINDGAFYQNGASADIVVPGNVKTIGVNAFKESKIKSVIFNDANSLILNTESFADIPTLASVAFRGNGVTIKQRVFSNDTGLTEVDIPNGTKFRGETDQNDSFAFQGTTGIEMIKINTETVYGNIFSANKNLAKVIFGADVTRVHYDWSGTAASNSETLSETVDRYTYSLNGDTIFEMNKTTGGSPFGYKGALTIVGQSLDLNSATNTYADTSNPVTAKIAYLQKHYTETEAVKTYAQGSASSITITVEEDPSANSEVSNTVTTEQSSIEAYYDGVVFTGKTLDKDKMAVYKMFGTVQGEAYSSTEFYVLRTTDASALLGRSESSDSNDASIAAHPEEIMARFAEKDSITANNDDLSAGTIDVEVIVLITDSDGNILLNTSDSNKVQAFVFPVAVPVKQYTAENDFLENYGSYQAVIDKIDSLQSDKTKLTADVENYKSQIAEKNSEITALIAEKNSLEGTNSSLNARITELEGQIETLRSEKGALQTQLTAAQQELSDTIAEYARLLESTSISSSDYIYSVTDSETGDVTDYVLVNGEEATYDPDSKTTATLPNGSEVDVYTGTDSDGNTFTFYVADDGVHVVMVIEGAVASDSVSSDTVSAMQHKIAVELASLKAELSSLKVILSGISDALNGIGGLSNNDHDYSIDDTKSESEQYRQILSVIQTLAADIKNLDGQLTSSKADLESATRDNRKYYDAMVLTYNTLSDVNLDTEQVSTVGELIAAVQTKASETASSLDNANKQNAIYAYQLFDRNLALGDIESLLNHGTASGVSNKISEIDVQLADSSISEDDRQAYLAQKEELSNYKVLIDKVSAMLAALRTTEENLDTANQNIESLEGQITNLKSRISSLEDTVRNNEAVISGLRSSISDLSEQNESQAATISSLESSVRTLETLSNEQTSQIESLDDTISAQKAKIDAGTATIEELSAAITSANSQISSLSEKNAELAGEINSLSDTVATLRGQNSDQAETIEALESQLTTLEENNTSLMSQISSLTSSLNASEGEIASLKNTVASLRADLETLQSENDGQGDQIRTLQDDLESARTLSSQYKMIVDTANTLLGLNLKNTDTKADVEAAIKDYIAKSVSSDDTKINTESANYKAGYSAGVASVNVSSSGNTYKSGYTAGYAAGLKDGNNASSSESTETISQLSSQVSSLSTENRTLSKQVSSLTLKNSALDGQVSALKAENDDLNGKVSDLTSENGSLDSQVTTLSNENSSLVSTNKVLTSQNDSLKAQVSSLSSKASSTDPSGTGYTGTATIIPTGNNNNTGNAGNNNQGNTTVKNNTGSSDTENKSDNKPAEAEKKDETKDEAKDVELLSTPVTASGTKYQNGESVTIKKPSAKISLVKASGQEATTNLNKISGDGITFDLNGATYKDTTDEQKDNAYTVIGYYLNHISELGDLGSKDLKNAASKDNYSVTADVLASIDVSPSEAMIEESKKTGFYTLNISSNELENGALYFIIHESDKREDTFDVSLVTAKKSGLTMKLKDLSPVTISKISFENLALTATDKKEEVKGGTTDEITSETLSGHVDAKRIIFIILGILCIGGAAFMFLLSIKKKAKARA
ncbi:MAG: leucine-rich repeat protein [Lachnospiraceae bacterium]|nr:leucine-rich repeat protein [Lachnospiraceae bacterium]